jgi:outer membrane protein OmpA-like peptidoglycan-associated protein
MKHRWIAAFLFCGWLIPSGYVKPAYAQQSSSSSSDTSSQSVSVPNSDTIKDPIPPHTPTDFWDGDEPNLSNLVMHPFASKKYVQRMTRPIKDRLNELDEITAADHQAIRDIDARSQRGLQMASEKESLADQHSTDAAGKAQMAQTSATQATTNVTTAEQMVGNLDRYHGTAQTEIRFRPGQTVLSKQAKDALDEMAAPLKDQRSYIIEVRGFSSGRGQTAIASSEKMADSVVRYLVLSHNIPVYRIYVLSMGDAVTDDAGTKHISGGRVEVNLMKNDVVAQR